MTSDPYQSNLTKLRQRFPRVAAEADRIPVDSISIGKTQDGGYCYTVADGTGGRKPITDPNTPIAPAKQAVMQYEQTLINTQNPALVIGLYPGFVLDMVYNFFEDVAEKTRFLRRIYVIVDSAQCLVGWLKAMDRSHYLDCSDIEFYLVDQVPEVVRLIETDRTRSHNFMPMSMLPDDRVNSVIEPLAQLFVRRQEEAERLSEENNAYYDALTDEDLAKIIAGEAGRKPRLLFPTHSSSTVVQYSARDTCEAFEELGWETLIHKSTHGCSTWEAIKTINEFKPDVYLMVNHLRTEGTGDQIYPPGMPFITWVQDSPSYILDRDEAEKWNAMVAGSETVDSVTVDGGPPPQKQSRDGISCQGQDHAEPASSPPLSDLSASVANPSPDRRRDLIIGYVDQLKPFGYREDRLVEMPMIVNTRIFRPRELTEEQKEKYGCDVMFASRCGAPTEERIEELFDDFNNVRQIKCSRRLLQRIHDHLWAEYRAEKTFTCEVTLKAELLNVPGFEDWFNALDLEDQGYIMLRLFWRLNDIIYRQVVVEWLIEYAMENSGFTLKLFGDNWDRNERFAPYASGILQHGANLSIAYRAARYSLHLNITQGPHQRIGEIYASGGTPLFRCDNPVGLPTPGLISAFMKIAVPARSELALAMADDEKGQLASWLTRTATALIRDEDSASNELARQLNSQMLDYALTLQNWLKPDWPELTFRSRGDLKQRLASWPRQSDWASKPVLGQSSSQVIEGIRTLLQREPPQKLVWLPSDLEAFTSFACDSLAISDTLEATNPEDGSQRPLFAELFRMSYLHLGLWQLAKHLLSLDRLEQCSLIFEHLRESWDVSQGEASVSSDQLRGLGVQLNRRRNVSELEQRRPKLLRLGQQERDAGRIDQALAAWEEILKFDPLCSEVWQELADLRRQCEDSARSEAS